MTIIRISNNQWMGIEKVKRTKKERKPLALDRILK
jgi:hypothetical protein